jgi:hypothetical protein
MIRGGEMTHREFLIWLRPRLDGAATTGLSEDGVRAIREELERMREGVALQPFASRVLNLVREQPTLDAAAVKRLAGEVRSELAPPREQTVVLSATSDDPED